MYYGYNLELGGVGSYVGSTPPVIESWRTELDEVWVDELANEWTNG